MQAGVPVTFRLRYISQGRVLHEETIEADSERAAGIAIDMRGADWVEVSTIPQPRTPVIRVAEVVTIER